MIGVIIVGGLAAMGIASMVRRHHRWHHHGYGWGGHHGWGHPHGHHGWSHGHGGFGGRCGQGGWGARFEPGADFERGEGEGPGLGGPGGMWFGGPGFHPLRLRRGRRWLMKALFRRLETTPTQQQALRAAIDEFQESAKTLKGEAGRTRSDVAAALRRPAIDAEALGELFARHDTALDGVRKAFVGMTIRVHDILDDEQRERLARLIEAGPRGLRGEMSGAW